MKRVPAFLAALLLLLVGRSKSTELETPLSIALPAEVQDAAKQRGKAIVAETFSLMSSNLQAAIKQGGVSNALPFCSLVASPVTASVAGKHGVSLRRVTHKPRNPADNANDAELAVLEQFTRLLSSTNVLSPLATNFSATAVTFFAPIVLTNELCLKCHGEPGRDIESENLAVIQKLYPQDKATGFKLGQLRGAWRIDMPRSSFPPSL